MFSTRSHCGKPVLLVAEDHDPGSSHVLEFGHEQSLREDRDGQAHMEEPRGRHSTQQVVEMPGSLVKSNTEPSVPA